MNHYFMIIFSSQQVILSFCITDRELTFFLAALDPLCCLQAFSGCSEPGPLSSCRASALTVVASVVRENRLQALGTRSLELCLMTQLPYGTWDVPGPEIQPVSLALADGFLSTEPLGKSQTFQINVNESVAIKSTAFDTEE